MCAKHILDTLKIGTGLIGLWYGIEYFSPEEMYEMVLDCPDTVYGVASECSDIIWDLPNSEIVVGFGIGVVANLTASFIKTEYGGFCNFIRRKRVKKENYLLK